jgi:DNA-binding MarR family transcriptional regulator
VLAALYYVPSMPLLKLAKRLETDRTKLTRSLERLERDGLVSIGPDPEDTRIRAIAITEAGLQKLVEACPLWMAAQNEMANALGARQPKEFRASLEGSIESSRFVRLTPRIPSRGGAMHPRATLPVRAHQLSRDVRTSTSKDQALWCCR